MTPRLSALLVQDRVVSFRQMDDAVQRQRRYGGRIGTNLLELGALDEATLNRYLGIQQSNACVSAEQLKRAEKDVVELLDRERAVEIGALPLRREGDRIEVLTVDPLDIETWDELQTEIGAEIEPFAVSEFRFWHALGVFYGVDVPERYRDLVANHPLAIGFREAARARPQTVAVPDWPGDGEVPGLTWSIAELTAFYRACESRDELLLATLGFVGKFFSRRAMLVVARSGLVGYAAHGFGPSDTRIADVRLPFDQRSALWPSCMGESYFLGRTDEIDLGPLYDKLGVGHPAECVVLPVRVGPRAAVLLIGDHEDASLDHRLLAVCFVIASQLSAALERLIREMKVRRSGMQKAVAETVRPTGPAEPLAPDTARRVAEERSRIISAVSDSTADVARGVHRLPADGWELPDLDQITAKTLQMAPLNVDSLTGFESGEAEEAAAATANEGHVLQPVAPTSESSLVTAAEGAPNGEADDQAANVALIAALDAAVDEVLAQDATDHPIVHDPTPDVHGADTVEAGPLDPAGAGPLSAPSDGPAVPTDAGDETEHDETHQDEATADDETDERDADDEHEADEGDDEPGAKATAEAATEDGDDEPGTESTAEAATEEDETEADAVDEEAAGDDENDEDENDEAGAEATAEGAADDDESASPVDEADPVEAASGDETSATDALAAIAADAGWDRAVTTGVNPSMPADEPAPDAPDEPSPADASTPRSNTGRLLKLSESERRATERVAKVVARRSQQIQASKRLESDAAEVTFEDVSDSATGIAPLDGPDTPQAVEAAFSPVALAAAVAAAREATSTSGDHGTVSGPADDEAAATTSPGSGRAGGRSTAPHSAVAIAEDLDRALGDALVQTEANTEGTLSYDPTGGSNPNRPPARGRRVQHTPIALDVAMPGVLQPPQPGDPASDDEQAVRDEVATASPDRLVALLRDERRYARDSAFVALLELGEAAWPAVLASFPYPLTTPRRDAVRDGIPLESHGPIVWLVALQVRAMLPHIVPLADHEEADTRFYAVQLAIRAGAPDAARLALDRILDRDEQLRAFAMRYVEQGHDPELTHAAAITARRGLGSAEPWRVDVAISLAAHFRDAEAAPVLIGLLEHESERTRNRAANALTRLSFMPFGTNRRKWEKWYRKVGLRDGRQWILDAMVHRDRRVRELVARELRHNPRIVVNYDPDFTSRQLKLAQRSVERYFEAHPDLRAAFL